MKIFSHNFSKLTDRFKSRQGGLATLESLIAATVWLVFSAACVLAISMTIKVDYLINDEMSAENLARNQIESVRASEYISFVDPGHGDYSLIESAAGYEILVAVTPLDAVTGQPLSVGEDEGIQSVVVTVTHSDGGNTTLEFLKVDR